VISLWLQFVACGVVVGAAGYFLSQYGEVIAAKSGVSRTWIGLVLLATVTSLPELVTGVTAVSAADAPNIAVGDVFGSCVFNLAILIVVDLLHRGESLYRRASQSHVLSAALGIVLTGVAGLGVLLGASMERFAIGRIGAFSAILFLGYAAAVRALFRYEQGQRPSPEKTADLHPELTMRQALIRYGVAACGVVVAGVWLPFLGTSLARAMGWHTSFVGTQFVAAATSLPELAVTVTAVRMGSFDMAIANLLGSNLFNMLVLVVDDFFYAPGPLLAHVSQMHAASALSAMAMSGLAIAGLVARARGRMLNRASWVSAMLATVYLFNAYVLYAFGR
jgi:cation:H+ antiporter